MLSTAHEGDGSVRKVSASSASSQRYPTETARKVSRERGLRRMESTLRGSSTLPTGSFWTVQVPSPQRRPVQVPSPQRRPVQVPSPERARVLWTWGGYLNRATSTSDFCSSFKRYIGLLARYNRTPFIGPRVCSWLYLNFYTEFILNACVKWYQSEEEIMTDIPTRKEFEGLKAKIALLTAAIEKLFTNQGPIHTRVQPEANNKALSH
uniref:Putative heavy metal stress responsive protein n=1 Tax=Eichhornia crassipes TaxID=44947 RepID=S5G1I2_EICCR|nr:putative heavy metal stress responsive protein [Pontederia crassipes]